MSNKHFKIVVKEAKKNESKSDGERAVDDYDTLIDGLKELGFEPSSNVRNGKIYLYRTRFTATKDGIKYGFTLNEDRTGEYLESIEVFGGSIYTGDPKDKDARVFKSVGEVLDALKQVDGKKPESKKSENATTEEDAIRKAFKSIVNHVPANEKSNFDEAFVTDNMEALLDLFNAWFVFDDGEFVTTVRVVDPDNENGDCYDEDDEAYQWNACYNVTEGIIDLLGWNYGEETVKQPIQDALFYDFIGTKYIDDSNESKDHKKSESLSLKQKELKDMARYGEAEDITTISDAEAKELRKKGVETVGVSRGTYGMNGALLRDKDGKKYVITARSSNLFYFV